MASKLSLRLGSRLFRNNTIADSLLRRRLPVVSITRSPIIVYPFSDSFPFPLSSFRFFSTGTRRPVRPKKVDVLAEARKLQYRRLWGYATIVSCFVGFLVLVLSNFEEQMMFFVSPSDALEKFSRNPSKNKFRLGGLVLEDSVQRLPASGGIEFVVTDLLTEILVRYKGLLPDLFREGHSVVVEGFLKPLPDDIRKERIGVSEKARSGQCYFEGTDVLAKHDEKYMPPEVAAAIERNQKILKEREERKESALAASQPS